MIQPLLVARLPWAGLGPPLLVLQGGGSFLVFSCLGLPHCPLWASELFPPLVTHSLLEFPLLQIQKFPLVWWDHVGYNLKTSVFRSGPMKTMHEADIWFILHVR